MNNAKSKKVVKVETYAENGKNVAYEGRLLGLIDDEEFNVIIRNKVIQTRCLTKQLILLANITDAKEYAGFEGLKGLRMVMAVKKKEGVNCYTKTLFISDKLSFISYVKDDGAAFTGENNSWLTIEEKEAQI